MNVASRPRFVGELIPFPSSKTTSWAVSLTVSKSKKTKTSSTAHREVEKNKLLDAKVHFAGWLRHGH